MDNNIGVTIGAIISLLVAVTIGLMIYYNLAGTGEYPSITERYTGLTNTSDITKTLSYTPNSASDFSGTYYNKATTAWATLPSGLFSRSGNSLTLLTNTGTPWGEALNMSKVNVTYYTPTGAVMRDNVNPVASTVFTLAPLVAIVLIAGIVLAIVTRFGKSNV